jgi:hypothetical protein
LDRRVLKSSFGTAFIAPVGPVVLNVRFDNPLDEFLERQISRVVFAKALSIARCDISLLIQIDKIRTDLADEIFREEAPSSRSFKSLLERAFPRRNAYHAPANAATSVTKPEIRVSRSRMTYALSI